MIQVYDIGSLRERKSSSPPVQIYAHQGEIAIVRLNTSGTKLATASDKGTLIRVWDTNTKQRLIEFRRGADPAQIYSIGETPVILMIFVTVKFLSVFEGLCFLGCYWR